MARLNITFASLDATNKTRPQSTAEGMTYTQNLVIEGSLSATNESGVYKIVHTDPVADATLPSLMTWVGDNVPDYSNQLYEVYIPEIKTSNTALGPTGVAATVYSFRGVKQSDHSLIATATVTANGTDDYPVGTTFECIIKPDLTRTDWRIINSVQGIIEVATSTSVASRNALMEVANTRAGGRDNYTIIFDSVTFTAAGESPTHSTTDVFWCEVIKTDDRIFIRTSAAINQGGTYFNRVYYSRMSLTTLAWSDWTPYNFQIMDIDLFAGASGTYNIPTIYLTEVMNGAMVFKDTGHILQVLDSTTLYYIDADTNKVHRYVLGTADATTGLTPVTHSSLNLTVAFSTSNGTMSDDNAWLLSKSYALPITTYIAGINLAPTSVPGATITYTGTDYVNNKIYQVVYTVSTKAYTVASKIIDVVTIHDAKSKVTASGNSSYTVTTGALTVIQHSEYTEVLGQVSATGNYTAGTNVNVQEVTKINGVTIDGSKMIGAEAIGTASMGVGGGGTIAMGCVASGSGKYQVWLSTSNTVTNKQLRFTYHFLTTQKFF